MESEGHASSAASFLDSQKSTCAAKEIAARRVFQSIRKAVKIINLRLRGKVLQSPV
jgi:hypothetical protein